MLRKCKLMGLLTPYQAETLKALVELGRQLPNRTWRPKDLGAFRGSHHAKTLAALCAQGYAERETVPADVPDRPVYTYRATPAGSQALELFRELASTPIESVPGRAKDRECVTWAKALCAS